MAHSFTVRICKLSSYHYANSIYSTVQESDWEPLPYEALRKHFLAVVGRLPRFDSVPVSNVCDPLANLLTRFRIIYVPEVNHRVFQVDGLTWHWGLVFGQLILYLALAELYKLAKRECIRRKSVPRNNTAT